MRGTDSRVDPSYHNVLLAKRENVVLKLVWRLRPLSQPGLMVSGGSMLACKAEPCLLTDHLEKSVL